jgi:hypothetical protein
VLCRARADSAHAREIEERCPRAQPSMLARYAQ